VPAGQLGGQVAALAHVAVDEQRGAGQPRSVCEDQPLQGVAGALDADKGLVDDGDFAGGEKPALFLIQLKAVAQAYDNIGAEPPQVDRLPHTVVVEHQHRQRQIPAFPSMAVRTVHHAAAPAFGQARDGRQLIDDAGRQQ
jgi:hypothetical protein